MVDHRKEYEAGKLSTTSGEEPKQFASPAPDPELTIFGQHKSYWVLSESERAKGFVRPVRRSYKHLTCETTTSMGLALAETYAAKPDFYGSTFCCACGSHFPVGEHGEFVWIDETTGRSTTEKVGT